jgi:hypothetical protein
MKMARLKSFVNSARQNDKFALPKFLPAQRHSNRRADLYLSRKVDCGFIFFHAAFLKE